MVLRCAESGERLALEVPQAAALTPECQHDLPGGLDPANGHANALSGRGTRNDGIDVRRFHCQQERVARKRVQPGLLAAARFRGKRERLEVDLGTDSGALQELQRRPQNARHRNIARRVAQPRLRDFGENLQVPAQVLVASVRRAIPEREAFVEPPSRARQEQKHVAGGRAASRKEPMSAARNERRQRRRLGADGQVTAEDWDAVTRTPRGDAPQHSSRLGLAGRDQGVEQGGGSAAHRVDVIGVGQDGVATGELRFACHEGWPHDLGRQQQEAVAIRHSHGVVTDLVGNSHSPTGDESEIVFAKPRRVGTQTRDEVRERAQSLPRVCRDHSRMVAFEPCCAR